MARVVVDGENLGLAQIELVARGGARVELSPQVATACQKLYDDLQAAAAGAPC